MRARSSYSPDRKGVILSLTRTCTYSTISQTSFDVKCNSEKSYFTLWWSGLLFQSAESNLVSNVANNSAPGHGAEARFQVTLDTILAANGEANDSGDGLSRNAFKETQTPRTDFL